MNQRHHVWKFCFIFLSLLSSFDLFSKKQNNADEKNNGECVIKFPFVDLNKIFFEEMLRKHPVLFSLGLSSLVGTALYSSEVAGFVSTHRAPIFGLSLLAILAMYLKRDCLLESSDSDDEESDDQDSENLMDDINSFAKSGVRVYMPGSIKTTFDDVAGLENAKADLMDFVTFLKNPSDYQTMGAKIPKGLLLSGAPGNGKTLLARALAGEAGCPFLYITASEFDEMLVGVGAARIRHLFEIARIFAPCIIFIDEIDAIGRKRSGFGTGSDGGLIQTLNQLLAQMDGFEQENDPIVIIGATNQADVLDAALLRPGRFDRKIEIPYPFLQDRCEILKIHVQKIKASNQIDIHKIAQGTRGFSGADLAELVNEAAILAVRENASCVTMQHFDQARDYMLLGRETKGMEITHEEYWNTAVHEAGHALMHVYQEKSVPLYKVTIVPRGGALGLTHSMEIKEKYSRTEEEIKASIRVCLAGSVAEEMFLGHRGVGAVNDLQQARKMATAMVMHFGMTTEFKDVSFGEFVEHQFYLPDQIATKLHEAIAKVIGECRSEVEVILLEHKDKLVELAERLMSEGTVLGSDVYQMCGITEPSVQYSLAN